MAQYNKEYGMMTEKAKGLPGNQIVPAEELGDLYPKLWWDRNTWSDGDSTDVDYFSHDASVSKIISNMKQAKFFKVNQLVFGLSMYAGANDSLAHTAKTAGSHLGTYDISDFATKVFVQMNLNEKLVFDCFPSDIGVGQIFAQQVISGSGAYSAPATIGSLGNPMKVIGMPFKRAIVITRNTEFAVNVKPLEDLVLNADLDIYVRVHALQKKGWQ